MNYTSTDIEIIRKLIEKRDIHSIFNMLPSDLEERDMADVEIIIEVSEIPILTPLQKLDLLGQAILTAYRYQSDYENYELLINQSIQLSNLILLQKIESAGMDSELLENPIEAIFTFYPNVIILSDNQKWEAFRISESYFFSLLYDILNTQSENQDELKIICIIFAALTIDYANSIECLQESMIVIEIGIDLIQSIDINQLFTNNLDAKIELSLALCLFTLNAYRATKALNLDSEALEWENLTDSLSRNLEICNIDIFLSERGNILMSLGRANESLKFHENVLKIDSLNKEDCKNAAHRFDSTKFRITGNFENLFNTIIGDYADSNEISEIEKYFELEITGNATHGDYTKMMNLLTRVLKKSSNVEIKELTSLGNLTEPISALKFFYVLEKIFTGDLCVMAEYLPLLERLSSEDTIFQLSASLSLILVRQSLGTTITWNSILPLVLQLFDRDSSFFFDNLNILVIILFRIDENELVIAADTLTMLVEQITFDNEEDMTPISSYKYTALSLISAMNSFAAIFAKIAQHIPTEANSWLERAARLISFSTNRVHKQLREVQLFKYYEKLNQENVQEILKLKEMFAQYTLSTRGKGDDKKLEEETQFMALLFPIYRKYRFTYDSTQYNLTFPELIHINLSELSTWSNSNNQLLNILYCNNIWQQFLKTNFFNKKIIWLYIEKIRKNRQLSKTFFETGLLLREILFPFIDTYHSFPILGIRYSGIFQNIPFDAIPLEVDENKEKVIQWLGEKIVTVLLTEKNQDMEILYNPISVNHLSIFANRTFNGLDFSSLPGVQEEVKMILTAAESIHDIQFDLYWETASNRENFLMISGSDAPDVLHIATHAITNPNNPSNSCFILSKKDQQGNEMIAAVGYHDIILMDLRNCRLVVLSTCSTYQGKNIMGEGIMGLAWAFKAAGAGVVIATKWKVVDQVAFEFWSCFYKQLFEGVSIGEAFRKARLSIMTQDKWKHPYYWSVFQLIV